MSRLNEAGRPQWEIDAIDALEDAREQRRYRERAANWARFYAGLRVKVKKGRGQRRNRRNRR